MKLIVGIDAAVVVSPCTLSLCSGALLRIRTPSHSLSVGGMVVGNGDGDGTG